jgi:hypothetical protein
MRKIVFISVLILFTGTIANAQDVITKKDGANFRF